MPALIILCLVTAIFYIYMGCCALLGEGKSPSNRTFFVITLIFSFWVHGALYRNLSDSAGAVLLWRFSSLVAWTFGSSGILNFVLLLYRKNEPLSFRQKWLIYLPVALVFLVQFASMAGFLYERDSPVGFVMENIVSGAFYLIYTGFSLAVLIVRHVKTDQPLLKRQSRIIGFSLSLTTLCIVLYGFVIPPQVDFVLPFLLPLFPLFWISAMWVAITRLKLLEFTPSMAVFELMNNIQDMVILADRDKAIIDINRIVSEKLGYGITDLEGMAYPELIRREGADRFLTGNNGTLLPVRLKETSVDDGKGNRAGWVVSAQDLTLEREYRNLSRTDHLTGLGNRNHLDLVLDYEFSQALRGNRSFSLILFDIDDFKKINDTHGHDEGDRILARLARDVRAQLRESDTFCRYGGEEFLIILPGQGSQKAVKAAEKIRGIVEAMESDPAPVTISLGVSSYTKNDAESGEIIKRADEALYAAKRNGKNRVELL